MPYEINIPITVADPWRPNLADHRGSHAVFFQALELADAALAREVHEAQAKPVTQQILRDEDDGPAPMRWRLTLLDDRLYEPFIAGLFKVEVKSIQQRPLQLERGQLTSRHLPYEVLAQAEPQEQYELQFKTPTTFARQKNHYPLPEPYSCYQSWWQRWQHFAPPALGINVALVDIVSAHMVISKFRLSSSYWSAGKRQYVGAVGRMRFVPLRTNKVDAHWWDDAAVLARFAQFCGTGSKTTQGMGYTVLVDEA